MSNSAFTPTVLTIGSAGGAGELNVINNPSGALGSASGWIGATASTTVSPLAPTVSTSLVIANAAAAEGPTSGGYYPISQLPSGLQNRKLKVEFYFTTPATDVYRVSVYKGSTRVALSTDSSGATTLPANTTGKFVAYFDTDNSASWSLNITRTSGTTGSCYITNVVCGPGIQPQGAVVGEWVSFTGTITDSTGANIKSASPTQDSGRYRRVGSSMEIEYTYRHAATAGSAGSGTYRFNLPSGFTFDSSALPPGTPNFGTVVGNGQANSAGGATDKQSLYAWVPVGATNYISLTATGGAQFDLGSSGFSFASTFRELSYRISVPIAEWAGSGTVQLAQNDVEYASNDGSGGTAASGTYSTGMKYGPSGSNIVAVNSTTGAYAVTSYKVQFQTPIQPSDTLQVEILPSGSTSWIPVSNSALSRRVNGTGYQMGIAIQPLDSTSVVVTFGNGGAYSSSATYDAAGAAWSSEAATKWRVRKSSAGAAVGFGIVSGSSAGLLPSSNSNLDDATATRLGLKQYLHGTTYNGGIAPTVTLGAGGGTLSSVDLASFVPYQTQDGSWKLKFNISVTVSSAARTLAAIDVVGISVSPLQAVYGLSSSSPLLATSYASNARFQIDHASSTTTKYLFSGEVTLSSKPTWAY